MTTFLILAALLVAAALAAVLLPLLKPSRNSGATDSSTLSLQVLREQLLELDSERRAGTLDPAQYETERAEIERRAIEDGRPTDLHTPVDKRPVRLAATVGTAVVALSAGLYLVLGAPAVLQSTSIQSAQQSNTHAVTPQQIEAMAAKLAERLQENPADGEGWLMLARSYGALGRFPEASAAFGRATSLLPEDAQLLSDYADTLAMAQGRSLQGEPEKIIKRALAADPRNIKALALSGSSAFERQDYAGAIGEWRKVLTVVPADSTVATRIKNSIADAEARSGQTPVQTNSVVSAKSIRGIVSLDSVLRGQVANTDTVFVFARAVSGPRMPLAIQRMTVGDLPARFTLDDSMGMAGGPKLTDHAQVTVGARISKSGSATPSKGDLEGYVEQVSTGSDAVRVTISKPVR
ncbi:MAG: c-type cytochrome biogenesis protein CcmI [Rhodocyclales bacterium RIFCSPLOWO2_02_FULL_63_24]|nr:MAG: c-type cytochrome biogenesis protein CcmI [Rhodocyclales bacterium RIFCSPLOWO2_02_FULL_63_24]